MLGTRKAVLTRSLFQNLPFDHHSDSDLFSSNLLTRSKSTDQNMTEPAASTISDLTNPFAGKIDLMDKVGLSLFVKATKGLPKEQKINLSQETACKTVKAIKQAK